jgi:hypothetical protein
MASFVYNFPLVFMNHTRIGCAVGWQPSIWDGPHPQVAWYDSETADPMRTPGLLFKSLKW